MYLCSISKRGAFFSEQLSVNGLQFGVSFNFKPFNFKLSNCQKAEIIPIEPRTGNAV